MSDARERITGTKLRLILQKHKEIHFYFVILHHKKQKKSKNGVL